MDTVRRECQVCGRPLSLGIVSPDHNSRELPLLSISSVTVLLHTSATLHSALARPCPHNLCYTSPKRRGREGVGGRERCPKLFHCSKTTVARVTRPKLFSTARKFSHTRIISNFAIVFANKYLRQSLL